MKTLVIKYSPREERSKTRMILDFFLDALPPSTDLEIVDLADNLPDLFTRERLQAYYKRNYDGQTLTLEETKLLAKMDNFARQVVQADILVVATPIYKFAAPAAVKAWIDSVMQRGLAYDAHDHGKVGKLNYLRVLGLYVGGIVHNEVYGTTYWNTFEAMLRANFEWAGSRDVRVLGLEGVDMLPPEEVKEQIEFVRQKILKLVKLWYT